MRPSFSLQVLWILVFASAGLSTPTVQIKETKRVLIINALGPTNPAYIRMDDQIRAVLESSPYQIELYHEYLETLLFPDPAKQAQFEDSIIAK
jgi:hypothetical protein